MEGTQMYIALKFLDLSHSLLFKVHLYRNMVLIRYNTTHKIYIKYMEICSVCTTILHYCSVYKHACRHNECI